ncbi:hypothetical protein ACFL15_02665 [Patescibacteria group bacterium]
MKKYWIYILLAGILFFGFILRVFYLKDLSLTFGYDQARDAYISQQILKGDLKILGPPASTPGLFHGVFYYYLLAPAYLFGNGSPIVAAYWIAFLNSLTIITVFSITYLITKKYTSSILSAILFAVSFEAVQYATWLSNPTIAVWTVPLMYLGLWLWTKEKKEIGSIVAAVGLGLSIQAEIFLLYQAVPLVIWIYVNKKNVTKKSIRNFIIFLILSVSTMILAEIKFGFKSLSGITSLAMAQDEIISMKSLGDFFVLFLNQIGKVFSYSSYPGNIGYGGVLIIFAIFYLFISNYTKKQNWPLFVLIWLFSHITVVSLGGTSTPFLLVGIGPAVSITLSLFITEIFKKKSKIFALIILLVVLIGNISMVVKQNPKGSVIFAIQKDMLLKKQFQAIDYTYKSSDGEVFSINTLSSPLWINIVWDYLYKWYGQSEYEYVPEWHGKDQVGQLGELPDTSKNTTNYYLILEPMAGIPIRYLDETVSSEDNLSEVLEEKNFGEIIVQKRERIEK